MVFNGIRSSIIRMRTYLKMGGLQAPPSAMCAGTRLKNKCFIRDKQHVHKDNF